MYMFMCLRVHIYGEEKNPLRVGSALMKSRATEQDAIDRTPRPQNDYWKHSVRHMLGRQTRQISMIGCIQAQKWPSKHFSTSSHGGSSVSWGQRSTALLVLISRRSAGSLSSKSFKKGSSIFGLYCPALQKYLHTAWPCSSKPGSDSSERGRKTTIFWSQRMIAIMQVSIKIKT